MNNIDQVLTEARSYLNKGYVFVHVKDTWLQTLLSAYEESQRENERLSFGKSVMSAQLIDEVEQHAKAVAQNIRLSAENAAMKEALKFYASEWNHDVQLEDEGVTTTMQKDRGQKARTVLSTLKCSPETS